jgi:hypothetical protein
MNLLFDFTVDKATNSIHITREFAADLDLVWDAFTNAEILDQWSAPKPWKARTKEMDFREGGRWLYAMVSPGKPKNDAFSLVKNSFKAGAETTTVYIEKIFDNLSTLEFMVSGGFKEGTAAALANLDEYLLTLVINK